MTGFIVTGTDTDVGKTVFAAALVAATNGSYWKPIQAGLEDGTDTDTVRRLAQLDAARVVPEVYRLQTPASPHVAAERDGVVIELDRLDFPGAFSGPQPLIIEGAGGVMVPLSRSVLQVDLFARWDMPVILVASTRLGTINHSLLSLEALRRRGLAVHGIAFSGDANDDSETTICAFGKVRRLGRLPRIADVTAANLMTAFDAHFVREDFLA